MDFLWSWALLLLVVVPALAALYAWNLRRRRPASVRYSSLALIRAALPRTSRLRRHVPVALFLAAVGILVIALARPAAVESVPASQRTIILTIDVSGSMCSSDIPPSRLQAAEAAAASFIKAQPSSTQIGIVAFSTFAELIQAPTTNKSQLINALESLTTGRRTAIGSGILASIDAIASIDKNVAPSVSSARPGVAPPPVAPGAYVPDIIVLLTDGASNTGPAPIDAARQAADRGIRIYTIGFGTANGGAFAPICASQFIGREPFFGGFGGQPRGNGFRRGIDEATLRQVAALTGGTYHPAASAGELDSVFQHLPTSLITKHEVVELSVGFVALGAALAAVALYLAAAWRPRP